MYSAPTIAMSTTGLDRTPPTVLGLPAPNEMFFTPVPDVPEVSPIVPPVAVAELDADMPPPPIMLIGFIKSPGSP